MTLGWGSKIGILDRRVWAAMCLSACTWFGGLPSVWAGEAGITESAPARFAVVVRLRGEVTAQGTEQSRVLQEGSPVFVGERLRAAPAGEALLKTADAGFIGVRPGVEFAVERFAAEGKKSDHLSLRLLQGSLRIVTGWIGRLNKGEHRVVTPYATIGIRGTDHEPYVLSAEQAASTPYQEGTYDKVNRGSTTLGEGTQTLAIEKGRVGFARAPAMGSKGLMTLLMPVLLEKVPDFYVPGAFDGELDRLAKEADATSLKQLKQTRKAASHCNAERIARKWLQKFDGALVARDAASIVEMFAPDIKVHATVRNESGAQTSVDIGREELARGIVTAVQGLKNYHQRRLTLVAKTVAAEGGEACSRVELSSEVVESGQQADRPYHFESREDYLLELRDGKWLAVRAATTQK